MFHLKKMVSCLLAIVLVSGLLPSVGIVSEAYNEGPGTITMLPGPIDTQSYRVFHYLQPLSLNELRNAVYQEGSNWERYCRAFIDRGVGLSIGDTASSSSQNKIPSTNVPLIYGKTGTYINDYQNGGAPWFGSWIAKDTIKGSTSSYFNGASWIAPRYSHGSKLHEHYPDAIQFQIDRGAWIWVAMPGVVSSMSLPNFDYNGWVRDISGKQLCFGNGSPTYRVFYKKYYDAGSTVQIPSYGISVPPYMYIPLILWDGMNWQDRGGISKQPTITKQFTVYENQYDMQSIQDSYIFSPDAKISFNGNTYPTNSSGVASIEFPQGYQGTITISKTGYLPVTKSIQEVGSWNEVYLEKEGGTKPIFKSVTINSTNIRAKRFALDLNQIYNLKAEINWNGNDNNLKSVYIKQGSITIPLTDGQTGDIQLGNLLGASGQTYIYAEATNGRIIQKKINLDVNIPSYNLTFGQKVSNFASGDLPFLDNVKFELDIPNFPIELSVDGSTVRGVIGIDMAKYEYDNVFNDHPGGTSEKTNNAKKEVIGHIKDSFQKLKTESNELARFMAIQKLQKGYSKYLKKPTAKFGFDASVSVMGYIEGTFANGGFYFNDSGLILMADAKASWSGQFAVAPIPMPLYWEAYIKGEIEAQLGLSKSNITDMVEASGGIEGTATLGGGFGAGIKGVVSAGGGIEGSAYPKLKLPSAEFTLDVRSAAYLKAEFLVWSVSKKWPSQLYRVYPNPDLFKSMNYQESIYDTESYQMQDRSYIGKDTNFVANGRQGLQLLYESVNPTNQTQSIIKTNVYPNSKPQLVKLADGKQLLVWIDDNRTKTDANRTCLMYSMYDGVVWSTPQAVQDDSTADFSPKLKLIHGIPYLVWQNANAVLQDDVSIEQMAQSMEISFARYNSQTNAFEGFTNLSNNSTIDSLPDLAGSDTELSVVWVNNAANDVFGLSGESTIMQAVYNGQSWSAAFPVFSTVNSFDDIAIGYPSGTKRISYTIDTDGDINTVTDTELFIVSNGESTQITSNEVLDSKPYFADDGKLYWYSGGQIDYIDDFSANTIQSIFADGQTISNDRFELFTNTNGDLYLLFEDTDSVKSDLCAFIYDKVSQKWSEKVRLTDLGSRVNGFSGFLDQAGNMKIALNKTQVIGDISSEDPYGLTDLCMVSTSPSYNLKVDENCYYNQDLLYSGNDVELLVDVTNAGELTAQTLLIELLDSGENVLSNVEDDTVIRPGETKTLTAIYTVPEQFTAQDIKIRVTPQNCTDWELSDNTIIVSLNCIDAALEQMEMAKDADGNVVFYANVVNRGLDSLSNVTVSLVEDALDGNVLEIKVIPSIASLASEVVTFQRQAGFAEGIDKSIYVVIDAVPNETMIGNNSSFVMMEYIDPDTQAALDAEPVIAAIAALGTVTFPNSREAILTAEGAYVSLSALAKSKVTNYNDLLTAREAYDLLKSQVKFGDINDDGKIDISDIIMAAEIAVGYTYYTTEQNFKANVNSIEDVSVDISDVILLIERVAGGAVPFPAEQ